MGVALYAIAAGLLIGWVSGGVAKVGSRAAQQFGISHTWIVPLALAAQIAWARWLSVTPATVHELRMLVPASTVALLAMSLANWRWAAARVVALGIALNLAVIVANGNLMPVASEDGAIAHNAPSPVAFSEGRVIPGSKAIVLDPAHTTLGFLSDRFRMRLPYGPVRVLSLGDALLTLGLGWWAAQVARQVRVNHEGSTWLRTSEPAVSSSSPAIAA